MNNNFIHDNPWQSLRRYTNARIGLGRAGTSLPTDVHLQFQLAHAKARDAVHLPLDFAALTQQLVDVLGEDYPLFKIRSQASDRAGYLQRPDLGRLLHPDDQQQLQQVETAPFDIAFVIADGLSSAVC